MFRFAALSLLLLAAPFAHGKGCVLAKKTAAGKGCASEINMADLCGSSVAECESDGSSEFRDLKEYMKGKRVIGVLGFNNEDGDQNYMDTFGGTVTALGGKFKKIGTDSAASILKDVMDRKTSPIAKKPAPNLCDKLKVEIKDAKAKGEKVILVGHSKGGASVQHLFLHCPSVAKEVEAVVPVQAVYGGSRLADRATATTAQEKIPGPLPAGAKAAIAGTAVKYMPGRSELAGGYSLSTKEMRALSDGLANAVDKNGQPYAQPDKTFCVTSYADAGVMPESLRADAEWLAKGTDGKPILNDGMVDLSAQHDPRLCRQALCVAGAHHTSLIERDSADPKVDRSCREGFALRILNAARRGLGKSGAAGAAPAADTVDGTH